MNELIEKIITRHAIRRFQERQIEEDVLEQILQAGLYAPSAGNNQYSRIVVCQDKAVNLRLGQLNRSMDMVQTADPKKIRPVSAEQPSIRDDLNIKDAFYGAPTVLTIFVRSGYYAHEDAAFMAENMWLAAHFLGLGACYIGRAEKTFDTEDGRVLFLELGVGYNTPGIIKYPFWQMAASNPQAVYGVMSALLLLLMAYELIGAAVHEWLGIAMFILVILHHVFNHRWSKNVLKGKYSPVRILQTALVVLVLFSMLGSMVSGIIISRHALSFLRLPGASWARTVHLLCGYWECVLMGLRLGLHWNIMLGIAGKSFKTSIVHTWVCRLAGLLVAVYGAYAFVKRGLPGYMFLQNQFVFFDFSEPVALFLLDYLAIMGLFVWIGYYLTQSVRKR